MGIGDFAGPPPPAPPARGPTLKQLLAPEEAANALRVEENGGRTIITFRGSDLFRSGSATVDTALTAISP